MELLFFGCLVLVCIIYGIDKHRQEQSKAALMNAISNNAEYTAKLEKRLAELEEKFNDLEESSANMDAAEFEKRWQSGVESIMNYSLMAAMGGGVNNG